ncbi:substrate-binding domain-containing protein [Rhodococcus sp. H36-A4]|uniref:LacI family DNA-binding transcriptional regulator n=1 Tax=Rhodococcus sp. H36-A4 TaxID=3004353 RepID=UPI0022AF0C9C|nr:substrate-binding domain-containing protein [Rhodococcus sp. H36-A4]MCZ4080444.1 substrate-binding domain-containing protein [Rhodococcus sp. H36-A4]
MESTVTLKTVAQAAGVHISTVSRALRRVAVDHRGASVGDLKLFQLAQDMGYVPNPNAASLTTKKSTAFGVLVPRLTDVVLSAMYDAIEETANRAGYETFVANTHDDPVQQRRRIDLLLGRNVDGLIFGDARLDSANLDDLARRGVKFVLISRRYPGMISATCDDFRGGWLAGEHLARLGHTRVGIVSGPSWASTGIDRLQGCVAALVDAGVDVPDEYIREEGFDPAAGRRGAEALLALPEPPTAIFATNDFSAIGVLGVLREHSLLPGRDIGVVGYNDISICAELTVPLTTIRSPHREIGVRATEMLLAVTHGLPVSSVALSPDLIVRQSTSC